MQIRTLDFWYLLLFDEAICEIRSNARVPLTRPLASAHGVAARYWRAKWAALTFTKEVLA